MHYMISMRHLPDELIKEIKAYLPWAHGGFLFIKKDDLSLHNSYAILFDGDVEPIDIEKLKELLILKRIQE